MNNFVGYVAAAIGGAALGGGAAWYFTKKKYRALADEEVASVKEAFSRRKDKTVHVEKEKPEKIEDEEEPSIEKKKSYEKVVNHLDYNSMFEGEKEEDEEEHDEPYLISPDEYGEKDEYERISLTYYADGYLTDDDDELVDNPKEIVGSEWPSHFGEYEEDAVFVRNDKFKCDYEILSDARKYTDVLRTIPPALRRNVDA